MKNLAFLYSGKPDGLISLQEDCNAIHELLERYNEWEVVANRPLESEVKLREDFENYKYEEIENLFIFYTGHAVPDGVNRETLKISLLKDAFDAQIILNSILESFNVLPKRTVIVFDACYSGKFIYNAKKFDDSIEILSSSMPHLTSSSQNINSKLSLFTHYFCEAIEQLSLEDKSVNFKNIHDYINDKNEQKSIYMPPVYRENTEMILTQDRSLYLLLEEFKSKFNSFKEMKDSVLEYVNACDLSFNTFIKAKTFSQIFSWLLKNKECLVCLFKEFNIEGGKFLEPFSKDNDCEARKKKASNSQLITDIILKIRPDTGKSLKECKVVGWFKYNTNHYLPMKIEDEIMDFSKKGNFSEKLPKELAKQLNGKNSSHLGLNLILHESLFHIKFQDLEIELDGDIGSFIENFKITTQFEFRDSNYDKGIPKISEWKTNSEKYENNQESKVKPLIYSLTKDKPSKLFGKRFSNSSCVLLVSDYTLLDENLSKVLKHGIPHIVCPQSGFVACDEREWEDVLVRDMKAIAVDCMDEAYENEQSLYFIYDNYKKVEAFQTAINNIANDTDYDNLKEG